MTSHGKNTLLIALRGELEVTMTRLFDAPRQFVFDAWTKPELLMRWLEAPGRTMEVCQIDLRAGGSYRFVWRGPGRRDVGMKGVYREVQPPERTVRTEAWEDWDAGETLVTMVLTEEGGQTRLHTVVQFPSAEVRDEVMKAGLEQGANSNFDRLNQVLTEFTQAKESTS